MDAWHAYRSSDGVMWQAFTGGVAVAIAAILCSCAQSSRTGGQQGLATCDAGTAFGSADAGLGSICGSLSLGNGNGLSSIGGVYWNRPQPTLFSPNPSYVVNILGPILSCAQFRQVQQLDDGYISGGQLGLALFGDSPEGAFEIVGESLTDPPVSGQALVGAAFNMMVAEAISGTLQVQFAASDRTISGTFYADFGTTSGYLEGSFTAVSCQGDVGAPGGGNDGGND